MFDQVMKRSNWVWTNKMGRFAEERRAFLCDLNEQGHSTQTLRNVNRILLAVAERVDVRRSTDISEVKIVRAAGIWAAKSCAPHSKAETREAAAKRFVYIAKNWLRFLGKWRDPERNPQFRAEVDSFLKELWDKRGYTNQTLSTRESALTLFFEWLGKQGIPLKEVSPRTLAAYFLENKARGWKKATIKVYAQSLRAFFRYAEQHNWCAPGLAKTNSGARATEAAGTLIEDLTWDAAGTGSVKIRGKGRKIRFCPLWKKTMAELRPLIRGRDASNPLFLNRYGDPITRFGIHTLVARHAESAATQVPSLKTKRVSPHTIRHTTATHLPSCWR